MNIYRMEKLDMKKFRCQAKVVGTVVTVAGAMLMTLYKGPIVEMVWSKYVHPHNSNAAENSGSSDKDWLKGSILLIIATFAWASFFILQVREEPKKNQRKITTFVFNSGFADYREMQVSIEFLVTFIARQ